MEPLINTNYLILDFREYDKDYLCSGSASGVPVMRELR